MAKPGPTHHGVPGESALREHERRKARREERTRAQHPRVGNALLTWQDAPPHEEAWARGAAGELRVAEGLGRWCHAGVHLLHDLRMPDGRSNIDHVAVAPSGVWVVDAKRYKGKVEVRRPLFEAPSLRVGGRDQTKLTVGLQKQLDLVTSVVRHDTPVRGALCFVEAEWPVFGLTSIDGVLVMPPKRLAKRINVPGPLDVEAVTAIAQRLRSLLPRD